MARIRLYQLFGERPERVIKQVILHCSDSEFGSRALLYKWHVIENGWNDVGYHFAILNGKPLPDSEMQGVFDLAGDGKITRLRPVEIMGAHCAGENADSIGICLIGKKFFTARQFFALITLMDEIKYVYPEIKLYGHYETRSGKKQGKTCPNLNMDWVRKITGIKND
jgi:N-acetylmuramoyl-L-alanine amidase